VLGVAKRERWSKAKNLEMVGASRERGLAPVENKPWNAAGVRSGDGPVLVKRDGAELPPVSAGVNP
jgi:hypothetical protein